MFVTDIDECQDDTDLCQQGCINTNGSYDCFCLNGYLLASDDYSCQGLILVIVKPLTYIIINTQT